MRELSVTDEKLAASIREGDYACYNMLFMRYYSRLCRYVYGVLHDREDAEDVVQELFMALWNHRGKIVVAENVSAYLYKMARNGALNHLRAAENYKKLLDKQENLAGYYEDTSLEADEFRIALYDCIDLLPDRSRQVLLMHRVEGMKQKEIAEKLDISVKTIKNQIWASLQRLRKCLEFKGIG